MIVRNLQTWFCLPFVLETNDIVRSFGSAPAERIRERGL
jgi:hypothetical protein